MSGPVGQSGVAMIHRISLRGALRGVGVALSLSSMCPTPVLAANAIDTLAAQMNEAAANARNEEGLAIAQKLETLVRRQQGSDNMNYAGVLHNEGMFLNNLGRFKEAADKLNAALAIKLRNNDAASIMRTSNILVAALMILERRSEALAVGKQSLAIGTQAFGPDDPRLADAIASMGALAREQEDYKEAEGYFQRALAIMQRTPNISAIELVLALDDLGDLYGLEGRFDDGEKLLQQALKVLDQAYGAGAPRAPNYSKVLNDLGNLYKDAGRLPEAEAALRKSYAIERAKFGDNNPNVAATLGNLANVLNQQSRYAEAEALFNQTLVVQEKNYGPDHPAVVYALNNLANNYVYQGRAAEAVAMQQRVLAINEKVVGPDSPDVARSLINLADSYKELGRPSEARPLYQRALGIFSQKFGQDSGPAGEALSALGRFEFETGRFEDAGPNLTRAFAIQERVLGPQHPSLIVNLRSLALYNLRTGKYPEARAYLERALAIAQASLGANHLTTSAIMINLADVSGRENKWPDALAMLRRVSAQMATRAEAAEPGQHFDDLEIQTIRAIWNVSGGHPDDNLRNEAFVSAQRLHETQAGAALALMSARFAAGSDAVAAVVRRQQDLKAALDSLDKKITAELGAPDGKRNDALIASLRAEASRARKSLDETAAQIQREFPGYAELSNPAPLTIVQTQALLKPDEALVLFLTMNDRLYAFAVTRESSMMQAIELRGSALAARVSSLRKGLFNGDPDAAATPFDLDASHDLYAALFGPIESLLANKPKLLVVPTASLTSLPFHVLVTRKPDPAIAPADRYKAAAWLLNDKAVAVLPSVPSLRALRVFAKASHAQKPFIGFGDPLLQRQQGGKNRMTSRNVQPFENYYKGTAVDIDTLRKGLAPLPETADELHAVAHELGASDDDVRLGAAATVTNLKFANLDQYRVVDFATHGLVAGEVHGLSEPALVLSLPEHPTADDDGLLTASRVARLRLDADWAVLSACNTAAGDRPGAEGLSGLARAFFYAGARALLVSHWPVDSEAAVKLTTEAFSELAKNPAIGRAEALRRSMQKLIADQSSPQNSDPAVWAPFVLVGEGG
jgi:CHAT domain-containing protein/Tfp pilus assembly protein PilF